MHESKRNPTKRVVCDYIAIMTDYYAKQLYNPYFREFNLHIEAVPEGRKTAVWDSFVRFSSKWMI